MQLHWCCPLSSPYNCLYWTCDWHPNSKKTNAIGIVLSSPNWYLHMWHPNSRKTNAIGIVLSSPNWCLYIWRPISRKTNAIALLVLSGPYYCLHSWAGFPPLCGSISQVGDSEPTNHEKGFVSDLGYICPQPGGGTLHFKDMLTRPLE